MNLKEWAKAIDEVNEANGWNGERSVHEWCALGHTELSEFYEEFRNGHEPGVIYFKDKYGIRSYLHEDKRIDELVTSKPEGQAVEMADEIIRCLHWFARYNIDPDKIVGMKLEYNKTRGYRHGNKLA